MAPCWAVAQRTPTMFAAAACVSVSGSPSTTGRGLRPRAARRSFHTEWPGRFTRPGSAPGNHRRRDVGERSQKFASETANGRIAVVEQVERGERLRGELVMRMYARSYSLACSAPFELTLCAGQRWVPGHGVQADAVGNSGHAFQSHDQPDHRQRIPVTIVEQVSPDTVSFVLSNLRTRRGSPRSSRTSCPSGSVGS